MDAVGGSNTFAGQHVLTDVTLSLLDDTGWYSVLYSAAGFNLWGWMGGCTFADGSCISGDSAPGEFYCDITAPDRDELCTHERSATGICTQDTHSTFDGCFKVDEFTNAVCTRAVAVRPGATTNIDGWYRGPFSRCIQESPGFGRNGYRYTDTSVNAQCYEMVCDGGRLYVVIDSTRLLCPDEGYIFLDQFPGVSPRSSPHGHNRRRTAARQHGKCGAELQFVAGARLGPCPKTSLMCGTGEASKGTLECPEDCSAQGTCKQGSCRCHLGYVGRACEHRICWDSSQCDGLEECHSSGECLPPGTDPLTSFRTVPPPPNSPPPPPPTPPPGFYVYGDWTGCPASCTGDTQATRTRSVECGGDCSTLEPPITSSPCPPQPCVGTACGTDPCGADNFCSAQQLDDGVEVTCLCMDGSGGDFCNADQSGCHFDRDETCCPAERAVAITGECCSSGMALDRDGQCCWESDLDACKICRGQTVLVDSRGTCCPVTTVDADGACCMDPIDACGTLHQRALRLQSCAAAIGAAPEWKFTAAQQNCRATKKPLAAVQACATVRERLAWPSSCWHVRSCRAMARWRA